MSTRFIESLCQNWNASPNNGLDGCMVDLVIVNAVHLAMVVLAFIRVALLCTCWKTPLPAVQYRHHLLSKLQLGAMMVMILVPFAQLNARLAQDGHDMEGLEIGTLVLTICTWTLLALICRAEMTRHVLAGTWLTRVGYQLELAAQSIKIGHLSDTLTTNTSYYFDTLFVLYYICCVFLACTAIAASIASFPSEYPRRADSATVAAANAEAKGVVGADIEWPEYKANIVSRIAFFWLSPFMTLGNRRPLNETDVWHVADRDRSEVLTRQFEEAWAQERRDHPNDVKLLRALKKIWGRRFFVGGSWKIFNDAAQFVGPVFLGLLIDFAGTTSDEEPIGVGLGYAFAMYGGQLIGALAENVYFQTVSRVGAQVRSALNTAVFRKAMYLSYRDKQGLDTGKINNIMTSDVEALDQLCLNFHVLWSSPLRIVVAMVLLYLQLQWASLIGAALMVIMIPIQKKVVEKSVGFMKRSLKTMDTRVKLVGEVMAAASIVKCYAWEQSFINKVGVVRTEELGWLKKSAVLQAYNYFLIFSLPTLVSVIAFVAFVAAGNELTPDRAFTALALFSVLRMPLILLPQTIARVAGAKVSLQRLQDLLVRQELDLSENPPVVPNEPAVVLSNANFAWQAISKAPGSPVPGGKPGIGGGPPAGGAKPANGNNGANGSANGKGGEKAPLLAGAGGTDKPKGSVELSNVASAAADLKKEKEDKEKVIRLEGVNVSVVHGKLAAVVGATGSGKSSLLAAMLGEMPQTGGERALRGKVAYVPQQAWIFNASIRDNILFGLPFHAERYELAVTVSSLKRDFELFPAQDHTEIGERGVNVSGGQKQRIAIARAVYSDADVYLFDDPLSALDAHVGRHVFEACIHGALAGKTRILVTNQMQFVPAAEWVIFMKEMRVEQQGPYDEVYRSQAPFRVMMQSASSMEEEPPSASSKRESSLTVAGAAAASSSTSPGVTHTRSTSRVASSLAPPGKPAVRRGSTSFPKPPVLAQLTTDPLEPHSPTEPSTPLDVINADDLADETPQVADVPAALSIAIAPLSVTAQLSDLQRPVGSLPRGHMHDNDCDLEDRDHEPHTPSVISAEPRAFGDHTPQGSPLSTTRKLSAAGGALVGVGAVASERESRVQFHVQPSGSSSTPGSPPTTTHTLASTTAPSAAGGALSSAAVAAARAAAVAKALPPPEGPAALIVQEDREIGKVSWHVIDGYVKSMQSNALFAAVTASFILGQAMQIGGSWWISIWTGEQIDKTTAFFVGIYAVWSILQGVFTLFGQYLMALAGIRAAKSTHERMFASLLAAPVSFFHTTPLGRIINRFTKDQADVDKVLPGNLAVFMSSFFNTVGAFVVIAIASPYTLVAFVPVLYVFYFVQRFFQATSRELKRLDAVTRSPIYAHFSQCLDGVSTIHAYKAQDRLTVVQSRKVDSNIRMGMSSFSANRWLGIRLELLGGLMVLSVALFVVLSRGDINPAVAGLTLSYALQITFFMMANVRIGSVTENSFNSVERILHYIELPSEAPAHIPEFEPPANWPEQGAVGFEHVMMRYRDNLPPVLRDLSFQVRPMEKVGVVGRTGAGKSTIFYCLYRLTELQSGKVTIDGRDASKMGLYDLRSRLSIIPQDPVVFTGTVRFNLDPFSQHDADALWAVLEKVHLRKYIESRPNGLDYAVEEKGENFSVGQRQLLCMARALLRKSKILVLDEATAAVDPATDTLIQTTIREQFQDCTTLTIAHRLNTVIDSDRVMVMDNGQCVEFGSPAELLADDRTVFYSMVAATGPDSFAMLKQIAEGKRSLLDTLVDRPSSPSSPAITITPPADESKH